MTVHETEQSITDWAAKTFGGEVTPAVLAVRANHEMAELLRELIIHDPSPEKIAEEAADVLIVLYRIFGLCGTTAQQAIDEKMAVNRRRRWKTTGDGVGWHVKAN